jgi:cell division protein FtsX
VRIPSFVLETALRDLRRTRAVGVGGILLTALAVAAWGGTAGALEAWDRLVRAWREELRMVLVLRPERGDGAPTEASQSADRVVVARARSLPGVERVEYVSARDALADLSRYLGAAATGIEHLPANPVPARLVVVPHRSLDAAALEALVEEMAGLPGVETVEAALRWVAPAERLRRGVALVGYGLAALVALLATVVIGGATRLAAERRRTETQVLRLFGVPEARVRGPLVVQAAVQGGAGALLGVALLVLGGTAGLSWAPGWLPVDLARTLAHGLPWPLLSGLVGLGTLVGLAGGLGAGRA